MNRTTIKRTLAALLCALLLLSCVSVAAFAAGKKNLAKCSITVASSVAYTGKARKAAVTVKDGKTVLKNGTDYTLAYANNQKIGTATVTVTAKKGGNYTGAKTLKFKIVPAKVKSLAAAKTTKTAVKLSWKAVKGAAGYAVYTYDKTAKTYTRVKNTKNTALTVKDLKAGKTYYFAVRAFAKTGGKTYWGAYSDRLKVKTAAADKGSGNRIGAYQKLFSSGTYLMTFTSSDKELGNTPVTYATKNGNVSIDTKISGIHARMLYLAKSGKTYLLMPSLRTYTELTEDVMGGEMPDFNTMSDWGNLSNLKTGTAKSGGKTYYCESRTEEDGTETRFLFEGDKLVQIDSVNADGTVDSTYISEFTGNVPDSLFQIPKNYTYMSLDWLM